MSFIEYALVHCPECEEEYQLPTEANGTIECVICGSECEEIE